MVRISQDERSPLLANGDGDGDGAVQSQPQEQPSTTTSAFSRAVIQCTLVMILTNFAGFFIDTPYVQILEATICRSFHSDIVSGADPRCKDNDVQSELSLVNGWSLTFTLIPGLLMAVPYGMLADSIGKKFILNLSIFGFALSQITTILICRLVPIIPIRAVWLPCFFNLIGGGPTVFIATAFAMISDSVQDEHRTVVFSYVGAAATAAELVASPIVYLIMQRSDWLCASVGIFLYGVAMVSGLLLPYGAVSLPKDVPADETANDGASRSVLSRTFAASCDFSGAIRSQLGGNRNLTLLLCSVMFTSLGKAFTHILNQYVTRRYGWTWSEAGLISSLRTAIIIVVMSFVLPAVDYTLRTKYAWSMFGKDMWLARACILAMVVAYLGIAAAPNSAVLLAFVSISSLASGYEFILRSLLGQAAKGQNIATVYTTMSVLKTTGLLLSGPLLTATFWRGLEWGGPWIGLPFVMAALLVGAGGLIQLGMREDKKGSVDDEA